MTGKISKAP